MKNIQFNNRSLLRLSAALHRGGHNLPYVALIERFQLLRLGLLVIVGVVALYVVVRLLYFEGSGVADVAPRPVTLQVEGLDELEVWLEERHSEWERSIVDTRRPYFSR